MRISSADFVGRRHELQRLDEAFAETRTGRAVTVLIGAEAGVGKTRLLQEHVQRCRAAGAIAVVGGCLELGDGSLPYAPVADALRHLAGELGNDRLRALLVGPRRWLARLIPDVSSASEDAGGVPPAQLFAALHRLLVDISSERQPVVLAFEDLHWADQSSLDLLRYLARVLGDANVMIVGTYRSDELHRRHALRPVIGELLRLPSVTRIDLATFAADEVATQLRGILGHPPDPALVSEVVARSGGNAFFVEELATAPRRAGNLPSSLRDVLHDRLDRLSPSTLAVLREAALIGQRFSQTLLERVAHGDHDVATALRDAVDANVLVIDGADLAFRHALVQEAIADDVLPGDRTRIHAAVATILQERPDLAAGGEKAAPSEIAHHFWQAHDVDRAFAACFDAAAAARSLFAYAEAQQHGERALELWEQAAPELRRMSRAKLLLETAQDAKAASHAQRGLEHARAAVDAAGDDEPDVRATAGVEWAGALWMLGRNTEGLEIVVRALSDAGPEPSTTLWQAVHYHGQMLAHLGRFAEAEPEFRRAIELARTLQDRGLEARAMHGWGTNAPFMDVALADETLREAATIQLEIGDVPNAAHTMANHGATLLLAGRAGEAIEVERRALALLDDHGIVATYGLYAEFMLALGLYRIGEWDEVGEIVRRAESKLQIPVEAILLGSVGGQLAIGQGRLDDARRLVDAADPLLRPDFDPDLRLSLVATGAELLLAEGHPEAALARLEPELDQPLSIDDQSRVVALAVHVAAELAESSAHEDADRRKHLADRAAAWVQGMERGLEQLPPRSSPRVAGSLPLACARADLSRLTGTPDPDTWQRAIEQAVAVGERPHEAAARYRRAAALVARDAGASPQAESELRAALAIAEEMGAAPLRTTILALARRVRLQLADNDDPVVDGDGTAGVANLTPREREILALVADGWTNPNIAEHLFISPKTVSVHVSNTLHKLGAANRAEAASMAVRLGLSPDRPRVQGTPTSTTAPGH